MIKDLVECCNCGYKGTVNIGQEECPKCNKKGCLKWQDIDNPEQIGDII